MPVPLLNSAVSAWRRPPAWIAGLLVGLLLFAVGVGWALSSPQGSSPDDDFHLASIWCARGNSEGLCDLQGPGANPGERNAFVPQDVVRSPCFAMDATQSGICEAELGSEPTPARVNDGVYPGAFYSAMHAFVGDSVARSVLAMRLANLLLASLLVGAAIALARPLARRAAVLGWLGTLVPLGLFVIPSTNPSSWAVAGVGTYWVFLLRWCRGPRGGVRDVGRWIAGVLAVVSAALAVAGRGDAAVYLAVATAAVLLLSVPSWRALATWPMALPAAVVVLAAVMFLRTGQSGALSGIGAGTGRVGWGLLRDNLLDLPTFFAGVWGLGWGLGWLDTPVSGGAAGLAVALAGVLAGLGLAAWWWRKGLAILLLLASLVAVPLWVLQRGGNVVGENVQPRYLLPLVVVTAGVVLLAKDARGTSSWTLRTPVAILVVLLFSVAQLLALRDQMRRYTTGIDAVGSDLSGAEWWWESPVPPPSTWLVLGGLAGVAFAVVAVAVARGAEREAADTVGPDAEPSAVEQGQQVAPVAAGEQPVPQDS
ncbi:MAG: DUF2142 domain-containing protein [Candidatus Nanopelagicales bacterium]